jgi:glucose dehydrogenase
MPPVVDHAGTVYVATGNPTPAFSATSRPGCNPSTNATVALNARTGRVEWTHTAICHDSWDYDTTQSPMLLELHLGGHSVRAVGDASKSGFYYTLDARTGTLISRTPELVRSSMPRPVPTQTGVFVCPGNFGGLEYGPASYNPGTRRIYLTATDMCMRFYVEPPAAIAAHRPGRPDLAGAAIPAGPASGAIVSIDPATGRLAWRIPLPDPAVGGTLSTAGGLVFAGNDDGHLYALDAHDGHILWQRNLGLRFGSAPIAYEINGVEFVAVVAGGSQIPPVSGAPGGGELFVFRLS